MEDSSPPAGYPRGPELAPAEKAKRSAEGKARRPSGVRRAKPGGQAECGGRSPEALGIEARRGETACLARCVARKPDPQGTPEITGAKKGATPLQIERGAYPRAIINSIQLLNSPAVHRIF
ncbi:hypothetical protein D3160_24915 [Salmonella enterica]|nr:hypothetical protein [Salmonella enterica subsp. enterica serovar Uganda]EBW6252067.1 hypothetical protein [Salmonella enterica subsp. enterica serovar Enteritidis]EBX4574710.1 hypothetical protein [Salmonella enterica subsp. enterica serovar Senftenberg]